MDWTNLVDMVNQAIYTNPNTPHKPGHDPDNLVSNVNQVFNQFDPKRSGQGGQLNPQLVASIFDQVRQTIWNTPSTPHNQNSDPGNLVGTIGNLLNEYARYSASNRQRNMQAGTSEGPDYMHPESGPDPYTDDQGPHVDTAEVERIAMNYEPHLAPGVPAQPLNRRDVLPASEDPFGDPAGK